MKKSKGGFKKKWKTKRKKEGAHNSTKCRCMYVKLLILKLMIQIYNFTLKVIFIILEDGVPNTYNGGKRIANKIIGYTPQIKKEELM